MFLKEVCEKHLTPSEGKILRDLISFEYVEKEKLMETLYGNLEDGGPEYADGLINIHIFKIRKKLMKKWKILRMGNKIYSLKER